MWLFFCLILVLFFFVISLGLALLGKLVNGVLGLFGIGGHSNPFSSASQREEAHQDASHIVRSEQGKKRLKQMKEMAEEVEFEEERD